MEKMRPFQIGLLAGFAVLAIVSIVILASFKGFSLNKVNPYGESVIIWGTLDEKVFLSQFQLIADDDKDFSVVDYIQKDPRVFEEELINAIAENRSPDAIMLEHEDLVKFRPKIQPIPYDSFPQRTIKDLYIDGAEIFARTDGLYAVPFAVDPIIMYWNRDIFAAAGLALPPATWEALTSVAQQLTLRDATRNILQSTVAFGKYRNVQHGKAALLTLLMQSGSRLIEENGQKYVVAMDEALVQDARKPFNAALQFYVEFSNANSPLYSWNRSSESDLDSFLAENLALYFGYGSEVWRIRDRNPNFNFDVANVPQGAGATVKRVYGKFYGLALLKAAPNPQGAYRALLKIGEASVVASLTEQLTLAPVHRSTIAAGAPDPFRQIVFDQALISRGWLDPDKEESDLIFKEMVEDVVSNRQKVSGAVADAVRRLELAF